MQFTDFITPTEEQTLLSWLLSLEDWKRAKGDREVVQFGFDFDYYKHTLTKTDAIPEEISGLSRRLVEKKIISWIPNQVIVNKYREGQKINAHIDDPNCFGSEVVTLSLGDASQMEFRKEKKSEKSEKYGTEDINITTLTLHPRSVLLLQGEWRYSWTHETEALKSGQLRYSITFRSVLDSSFLGLPMERFLCPDPCCDAFQKQKEEKEDQNSFCKYSVSFGTPMKEWTEIGKRITFPGILETTESADTAFQVLRRAKEVGVVWITPDMKMKTGLVFRVKSCQERKIWLVQGESKLCFLIELELSSLEQKQKKKKKKKTLLWVEIGLKENSPFDWNEKKKKAKRKGIHIVPCGSPVVALDFLKENYYKLKLDRQGMDKFRILIISFKDKDNQAEAEEEEEEEEAEAEKSFILQLQAAFRYCSGDILVFSFRHSTKIEEELSFLANYVSLTEDEKVCEKFVLFKKWEKKTPRLTSASRSHLKQIKTKLKSWNASREETQK